MFKVNILGRTYSISSSIPFSEVNKIAKEINEKYKNLENIYKAFDKVDILVIYLIELYETIYNLKRELFKKEEFKNKIKEEVEKIEKDLEFAIESLTKK
jgi:cell division protein ZapA (FtsZ GTPase activity inhibitor)